MSRDLPWVNRPSEELTLNMRHAEHVRLYLVQEVGPLSFVLRGEDSADGATATKFRVQLGAVHSCTCSQGKLRASSVPCVHMLFVLLRIFRLSSENPLVWQPSLVDIELQQILTGRAHLWKKVPPPSKGSSKQTKGKRRPLDDDDVCAICQDDFESDKDIAWCEEGCGNPIHRACMLVWAQHRKSVHDKITCPFCRMEWSNGAVARLSVRRQSGKPSVKDVMQRRAEYRWRCSECKKHLWQHESRAVYRCRQCYDPETFLCGECFSECFAHMNHDFLRQTLRDPSKFLSIDSRTEVFTEPSWTSAMRAIASGIVVTGSRSSLPNTTASGVESTPLSTGSSQSPVDECRGRSGGSTGASISSHGRSTHVNSSGSATGTAAKPPKASGRSSSHFGPFIVGRPQRSEYNRPLSSSSGARRAPPQSAASRGRLSRTVSTSAHSDTAEAGMASLSIRSASANNVQRSSVSAGSTSGKRSSSAQNGRPRYVELSSPPTSFVPLRIYDDMDSSIRAFPYSMPFAPHHTFVHVPSLLSIPPSCSALQSSSRQGGSSTEPADTDAGEASCSDRADFTLVGNAWNGGL